MKLTRDEQIAALQKTGSGKYLPWARPGIAAIAAGLILTGAITSQPVFYGAALVAGLLGLAIWRTTPHLLNAVRGLTEGIRQEGTVDIRLRRLSDGEKEHEVFQGVVSMDHQPLWQMDFIQPRGWEPIPGLHSIQLAFIRGVAWPVVLILDDGILIPANSPERISKSQIMS